MKVKQEILSVIRNVYRIDEIDFIIEWQNEPDFDDVRDELEAKLFQKILFINEENNWYVVDENESIICENLTQVYDIIFFMMEKAYTDVYGANANDCFNSVEDLTFDIINIMGERITLK
jgi:hypothetical protein